VHTGVCLLTAEAGSCADVLVAFAPGADVMVMLLFKAVLSVV
jgi:hypothetical protein